MQKKITQLAKNPVLLLLLTIAGVVFGYLQYDASKKQPIPSPRPPTPSVVSGTVFNDDVRPQTPLASVEIQYLPTGKTAASDGVYLTTSGLDGKFSFDCDLINPTHYPVQLQLVIKFGNDRFHYATKESIPQKGNRQLNVPVPMKQVSRLYIMTRRP